MNTKEPKAPGNIKMIAEVDRLIHDIQVNNWSSQLEVKKTRSDADCVHSDGFYFFNLNVHRTMILIEFDENKRARVVWAGSHQDYNKTFKNNKNTIKNWLKEHGWV